MIAVAMYSLLGSNWILQGIAAVIYIVLVLYYRGMAAAMYIVLVSYKLRPYLSRKG